MRDAETQDELDAVADRLGRYRDVLSLLDKNGEGWSQSPAQIKALYALITQTLDALSTLNRSAPIAEPVAWQWSWADKDHWQVFGVGVSDAARADFIRDQERIAPIIVRPLYTHPSPAEASPREAMLEIVAELKRADIVLSRADASGDPLGAAETWLTHNAVQKAIAALHTGDKP